MKRRTHSPKSATFFRLVPGTLGRMPVFNPDWHCAIALRSATAVLGKESRCVHTTPVHCIWSALPGFVVTEDKYFSQVVSPRTIQWLAQVFL